MRASASARPSTPGPARPRLLTLAVALIALVIPLLAVAAPASADPADDWESPTKDLDCAGVMECLVFALPYTGPQEDPANPITRFPTQRSLELVPLQAGAGVPSGLFAIRDTVESRQAGSPRCLAVLNTSDAPLTPWACDDLGSILVWPLAVAVEPVGTGPERLVDARTWQPHSAFDRDRTADTFLLRAFVRIERRPWQELGCLGSSATNSTDRTIDRLQAQCGPNQQVSLHTITDVDDNGYKSAAQIAAARSRLLGAAFANAIETCEQNKDQHWCKMQATDPETGAPLSAWSRLGEAVLTNIPDIGASGSACAGGGGGGAQSIYNGGSEPMTTTISASATNEVETSISASLAISTEFSFGKDSAFFKASLGVTATTEWGRTWTQSTEVGQEVGWTIPPNRYATAVLTASSLTMNGSWQFGPDDRDPWRLVNATNVTVPYSRNPSAKVPDSTMAVYNSWQRKDCDAQAGSVLAPGKQVGLTNLSAPDAAPIVGDVLTAEVGDSTNGPDRWWDLPSAAEQAPVSLRYQWYRVRGDRAPEPIPGARERTYTVTGDDVTDPEIVEWVGPYHLFVGVTDVATPRRFDSAEYVSLATGSVTEGPRRVARAQLDLSVTNPGASAVEDTTVEVAASIVGGDGPVDGEVTVLSGGTEVGRIDLGAGGTGRTGLRLPAGSHDLVAVYAGPGPLDGVRSAQARITVRPAPVTVEIVAPDHAEVDGEVRVRAHVAGEGPVPTGTVQFLDGTDEVSDPVSLTADGTATTLLPGLRELGTRRLSAHYSGDPTYAAGTSAPVHHTVSPRATRTTLEVDPTPLVVGRPVTLQATVAHTDGTPVDGTVEVTADGVRLGSPVELVDGRARIVDIPEEVGTTEYVARTIGTRRHASSEDRIAVRVRPQETELSLRGPDLPSTVGRPIALTTVLTGAGAAPGGTVELLGGGEVLGSVQVGPGRAATLRTSALGVGRHRLWARYTPPAGATWTGATSASVIHEVRQRRSTVRGLRVLRGSLGASRVRIAGTVHADGIAPSGRVWAVVDGTALRPAAVRPDGSFVVVVPAARLGKRTAVQVVYGGSDRGSLAGARARIVVRR